MENNKPIIQIYQPIKTAKPLQKKTKRDIIVTKYETKVTYDEEGNKIEKRTPVKVNITKKVNETAKLVKEQTAAQKLAEMEKIFSK